VQLFCSVVLNSSGIDYHVVLAQNAFQQSLHSPELQPELLAILAKQTSRQAASRHGVQVNCIGPPAGQRSQYIGVPPGRIDSESRFAIFLARILWKMRLDSRENISASLASLTSLARREKCNILCSL
jgi:hypothetical protein